MSAPRTRRLFGVAAGLVVLGLLAGCQPVDYTAAPGGVTVVPDNGQAALAKPEKPPVPARPARPAPPVLVVSSSSSPAPGTPATPAPVATDSIPIPAPSQTIGPKCNAQITYHSTVEVGVTVANGTATVQWNSSYDPVIQSWTITAMPNGPKPTGPANPIRTISVKPTGFYQNTVTGTVPGLLHGESYIFWLDAIVNDNELGGTTAKNLGRSNPITA